MIKLNGYQTQNDAEDNPVWKRHSAQSHLRDSIEKMGYKNVRVFWIRESFYVKFMEDKYFTIWAMNFNPDEYDVINK